jgi:xyloglucan-specific endo-beta-1,4-glucanase
VLWPKPSQVHLSLIFASHAADRRTGKTQCEAAGAYQLCQNLWGTSAATSGSQSSNLVSASGNSVSWSTTWTWAGGPNSVKSYANVQSSTAKGMTLASIASAPTAWSWSYASVSSDVRADVSYDIWLGTTPDGAPASSASTYEIMIWLSGRGGIQPVGSQAQTGINIGGHTWTLWSGPNTNWHVYSFVSASGDINSFSGDLNAFFRAPLSSPLLQSCAD